MTKQLQLEEAELRTIATSDLLIRVLDYPLLNDIFGYDNNWKGIQAVSNQFNGLEEFLSRPDSATTLLDLYTRIEVKSNSMLPNSESKGYFASRIIIVEALLMEESMIDQLDKESLETLLEEALKKSNQKIKYPDTFGYESQQVNILLMGKILSKIAPQSYETLMNNGNLKFARDFGKLQFDSYTDLAQIVQSTQEYLKQPENTYLPIEKNNHRSGIKRIYTPNRSEVIAI